MIKQIIEKNKKSGLTLIEMLIAGAILTLVILAASSLLVMGLRLFNFNSTLLEGSTSTRLAITSITRDIRMYESDDIKTLIFDDQSSVYYKDFYIGNEIRYRLDKAGNTLYKTTYIDGVESEGIITDNLFDINIQVDQVDNKIYITVKHTQDANAKSTEIAFRR